MTKSSDLQKENPGFLRKGRYSGAGDGGLGVGGSGRGDDTACERK
jgi:hypothetical protein